MLKGPGEIKKKLFQGIQEALTMKTIDSFYFYLVFNVMIFCIVLEWTMHPYHPLGIYASR